MNTLLMGVATAVLLTACTSSPPGIAVTATPDSTSNSLAGTASVQTATYQSSSDQHSGEALVAGKLDVERGCLVLRLESSHVIAFPADSLRVDGRTISLASGSGGTNELTLDVGDDIRMSGGWIESENAASFGVYVPEACRLVADGSIAIVGSW